MTPQEITEFNELMTRTFSGDFHGTFVAAGLTGKQITKIRDLLHQSVIAKLEGQREAIVLAIAAETARLAERAKKV